MFSGQRQRPKQLNKEETEIYCRDEDKSQTGEEQTECQGVQGEEEAEIPVPGRSDSGAGASQREAEGGDEQVRGVVQHD